MRRWVGACCNRKYINRVVVYLIKISGDHVNFIMV